MICYSQERYYNTVGLEIFTVSVCMLILQYCKTGNFLCFGMHANARTYLLSKVNVRGAEPVLHLRGLSSQPHSVCRPPLHAAGGHGLGGYVRVAVEGELDFLGLSRPQQPVQRQDVKHLRDRGPGTIGGLVPSLPRE